MRQETKTVLTANIVKLERCLEFFSAHIFCSGSERGSGNSNYIPLFIDFARNYNEFKSFLFAWKILQFRGKYLHELVMFVDSAVGNPFLFRKLKIPSFLTLLSLSYLSYPRDYFRHQIVNYSTHFFCSRLASWSWYELKRKSFDFLLSHSDRFDLNDVKMHLNIFRWFHLKNFFRSLSLSQESKT